MFQLLDVFWLELSMCARYGRMISFFASCQDQAHAYKMAKMGSSEPAVAWASDVQQMQLWALAPREMTQQGRALL